MNVTSVFGSADMPSRLTTFLAGGVVTVCGAICSITLISYMIYDKRNKYNPDIDKETEEMKECRLLRLKKIKYGQQFFNELDELEDRELTNSEMVELRNKSIVEETPEGNVIMLYNSDTESFWIYSKTKNISFRTLDAVARKYTIKYNCKQVCINHRNEIEETRGKLRKEYEDSHSANEDKPVEEDVNRGVFMTKKVKKASKKSIMRRYNRVILSRVNRFTYKGTIEDYKKEEEKKTAKPDNRKELSFEEFKALIKKNNYVEYKPISSPDIAKKNQ